MDDGFVFCLRPIRVDYDVVHINQPFAAINELHQFIIHHYLNGRRGVCETEEHDRRLKEAVTSLERSLPLVAFLDSDIVISPADVEFCKPLLS